MLYAYLANLEMRNFFTNKSNFLREIKKRYRLLLLLHPKFILWLGSNVISKPPDNITIGQYYLKIFNMPRQGN